MYGFYDTFKIIILSKFKKLHNTSKNPMGFYIYLWLNDPFHYFFKNRCKNQ
jgi:hypothetical protein